MLAQCVASVMGTIWSDVPKIVRTETEGGNCATKISRWKEGMVPILLSIFDMAIISSAGVLRSWHFPPGMVQVSRNDPACSPLG